MIKQSEIENLYVAARARREMDKVHKALKDGLTGRTGEPIESGIYALVQKSRTRDVFDREAFACAHPELAAELARYTSRQADTWIEPALAAGAVDLVLPQIGKAISALFGPAPKAVKAKAVKAKARTVKAASTMDMASIIVPWMPGLR